MGKRGGSRKNRLAGPGHYNVDEWDWDGTPSANAAGTGSKTSAERPHQWAKGQPKYLSLTGPPSNPSEREKWKQEQARKAQQKAEIAARRKKEEQQLNAAVEGTAEQANSTVNGFSNHAHSKSNGSIPDNSFVPGAGSGNLLETRDNWDSPHSLEALLPEGETLPDATPVPDATPAPDPSATTTKKGSSSMDHFFTKEHRQLISEFSKSKQPPAASSEMAEKTDPNIEAPAQDSLPAAEPTFKDEFHPNMALLSKIAIPANRLQSESQPPLEDAKTEVQADPQHPAQDPFNIKPNIDPSTENSRPTVPETQAVLSPELETSNLDSSQDPQHTLESHPQAQATTPETSGVSEAHTLDVLKPVEVKTPSGDEYLVAPGEDSMEMVVELPGPPPDTVAQLNNLMASFRVSKAIKNAAGHPADSVSTVPETETNTPVSPESAPDITESSIEIPAVTSPEEAIEQLNRLSEEEVNDGIAAITQSSVEQSNLIDKYGNRVLIIIGIVASVVYAGIQLFKGPSGGVSPDVASIASKKNPDNNNDQPDTGKTSPRQQVVKKSSTSKSSSSRTNSSRTNQKSSTQTPPPKNDSASKSTSKTSPKQLAPASKQRLASLKRMRDLFRISGSNSKALPQSAQRKWQIFISGIKNPQLRQLATEGSFTASQKGEGVVAHLDSLKKQIELQLRSHRTDKGVKRALKNYRGRYRAVAKSWHEQYKISPGTPPVNIAWRKSFDPDSGENSAHDLQVLEMMSVNNKGDHPDTGYVGANHIKLGKKVYIDDAKEGVPGAVNELLRQFIKVKNPTLYSQLIRARSQKAPVQIRRNIKGQKGTFNFTPGGAESQKAYADNTNPENFFDKFTTAGTEESAENITDNMQTVVAFIMNNYQWPKVEGINETTNAATPWETNISLEEHEAKRASQTDIDNFYKTGNIELSEELITSADNSPKNALESYILNQCENSQQLNDMMNLFEQHITPSEITYAETSEGSVIITLAPQQRAEVYAILNSHKPNFDPSMIRQIIGA